MKKMLKPALWALYFLAMVAVMTYIVTKGASRLNRQDPPLQGGDRRDSHLAPPWTGGTIDNRQLGEVPKVDSLVSTSGQKLDSTQDSSPMEVLKKSLAEKETQLAAKESEVQSMKERLSQKEQEVKNLETRIQQLTDERGQTQNAEFVKLSKAYAVMKPQQAAELLKVLDKPKVLKILASMREREAAKVMEEMGPEFVKGLTQDILKGDQSTTPP